MPIRCKYRPAIPSEIGLILPDRQFAKYGLIFGEI